MTVSPKELEAVSKLDSKKRCRHFVKSVAASGSAWGLWDNGWALMTADETGADVFPIWPAKEYAEQMRALEWSAYEASEIPLDDILDELVPKLTEAGLLVSVFPVPDSESGHIPAESLRKSLIQELEEWYSWPPE